MRIAGRHEVSPRLLFLDPCLFRNTTQRLARQTNSTSRLESDWLMLLLFCCCIALLCLCERSYATIGGGSSNVASNMYVLQVTAKCCCCCCLRCVHVMPVLPRGVCACLRSWSFFVGCCVTVLVVGSTTHRAAAALCLTAWSSRRYATVSGGRYNTAAGQDSLVLGSFGNASHDSSAVLAFRAGTDHCQSMGNGTVNMCVDNGFFVDGALVNATAIQQQFQERALDASNVVAGVLAVVGGGQSNSAAGNFSVVAGGDNNCLLYTSPSPRDRG